MSIKLDIARKSQDFQTPIEVASYMVSLIPLSVKTVLEPTPGEGNIVNLLLSRGLKVNAPEDYFSLDKKSRFDCVCMNPPFSSKYAFNVPDNFNRDGMRLGYQILKECMVRSDYVIALMPWFTISDSDVRLRSLYKWGLKSITALPRKTFQFAGIQTCVFELVHGFKGETHFKVLDLINYEAQPNLFTI